jgi:hypothetical protein
MILIIPYVVRSPEQAAELARTLAPVKSLGDVSNLAICPRDG